MTQEECTGVSPACVSKNIALVKRFFNEIWNDRKIENIEEVLSPDFISHYEHDNVQGIDSWKENIYETLIAAIPDIHIEIEDIIATGDKVSARWKVQGHHKGELFGVTPSGESVEFRGMSWVKIKDCKVVENWTSWNMSYLLRQLLSEVKALKGILPICSFCKKIRDDKGYWEQVEVYVTRHSNADFSHGVCPECLDKHYPNFITSKIKV